MDYGCLLVTGVWPMLSANFDGFCLCFDFTRILFKMWLILFNSKPTERCWIYDWVVKIICKYGRVVAGSWGVIFLGTSLQLGGESSQKIDQNTTDI